MFLRRFVNQLIKKFAKKLMYKNVELSTKGTANKNQLNLVKQLPKNNAPQCTKVKYNT